MSDADTNWVRVRQPETGHHITISRAVFEASEGLTALKQTAVDANGDPLPPKYHVDNKASARSNTAQATEKENTK